MRAPTSRDQMLFETLLTAFGQTDPSGSSRSHSVAIPDVIRLMPAGTRRRDLVPSLQRLASTSMDLTSFGRSARIQPLIAFDLTDDRLRFTLDPVLRELLSRTRGDRYGYLDLGRAREFGSGFTLPVYRHLVALHGPNPLPRTMVLEMPFEEIARVAGFRPQRTGGFRGQLDRVLIGVQKDLDRDQTDLQISIRWRGDDGCFLDAVGITAASPLPDLRRLRSRALDKTYRHELEAIVRPDTAPFAVSMSAWAKIGGLVRRPNPQPVLERLSEAFDLAIDEIVRMDDATFAPLRTTETGFATSPVRGARLRELIEREGIDRAAVLFAIEELREPDLTSDLARDLAIGTRLVRYVREAREARHAHGRGWDRHPPARWSPAITPAEIEARIAERLRIAESARKQEADLLADRLAQKLAKMTSSREGRNARRRQRRAEGKGGLLAFGELRPRERRRLEREWAEREDDASLHMETCHEDDGVNQDLYEEGLEDDIVEYSIGDEPSEEELERLQRDARTDHSAIPF